MNKTEKQIKISILGKNYTVVTDEQDVDVYAAAEMVDRIFREKGASVSLVSQQEKIAVIAALQIATELVKTQKKMANFENVCTSLTGVIEQNL